MATITVSTNVSAPIDQVFEVYTDQDALARHRETPHFKAYQAATADMVLERSVQASYVIDTEYSKIEEKF